MSEKEWELIVRRMSPGANPGAKVIDVVEAIEWAEEAEVPV